MSIPVLTWRHLTTTRRRPELGLDLDEAGFVAAMAELDDDGSGEVDFPEFLSWWQKNAAMMGNARKMQEDMQRLQMMFDEIDTDKSGELDAAEIGTQI